MWHLAALFSAGSSSLASLLIVLTSLSFHLQVQGFLFDRNRLEKFTSSHHLLDSLIFTNGWSMFLSRDRGFLRSECICTYFMTSPECVIEQLFGNNIQPILIVITFLWSVGLRSTKYFKCKPNSLNNCMHSDVFDNKPQYHTFGYSFVAKFAFQYQF